MVASERMPGPHQLAHNVTSEGPYHSPCPFGMEKILCGAWDVGRPGVPGWGVSQIQDSARPAEFRPELSK